MNVRGLAPILLAAAAVITAAVFVAVNVVVATDSPAGAADVVWDHEVCAHCRMHIGDPTFAAQVQTTDGRVLNFDDPGCAFAHVEDGRLEVRAFWFRHRSEDRWIAADRVAFVAVAQSPMGFGYAAADAGTPDSISLAEARTQMLRKD